MLRRTCTIVWYVSPSHECTRCIKATASMHIRASPHVAHLWHGSLGIIHPCRSGLRSCGWRRCCVSQCPVFLNLCSSLEVMKLWLSSLFGYQGPTHFCSLCRAFRKRVFIKWMYNEVTHCVMCLRAFLWVLLMFHLLSRSSHHFGILMYRLWLLWIRASLSVSRRHTVWTILSCWIGKRVLERVYALPIRSSRSCDYPNRSLSAWRHRLVLHRRLCHSTFQRF